MAGKIFINYRREDSIGMAGRLHDRLAQTFGRDKLFMDVDHIPVGVDFVAHLNSQVAACDVFLVVIGPNWLDAKDESGAAPARQSGRLRCDRNRGGACPQHSCHPCFGRWGTHAEGSELPDSLKPLARRHAVEVRQLHFDRDAEALIERVREALNGGSVGPRSWRGAAMAGVAAAAGLLLVGWTGLHWMGISVWPPWADERGGKCQSAGRRS